MNPTAPSTTRVAHGAAGLAALAALVALHGVAAAQRCVDSGRLCCDYCHMFLETNAFGAELVTPSGERLVFDAVECLAAFRIANPDSVGPMGAIDHEKPGTYLDVRRASYVRSDSILSPMMMNVAAFASKQRAAAAQRRLGGELLSFEKVVALVRSKWYPHVPADSAWNGRDEEPSKKSR